MDGCVGMWVVFDLMYGCMGVYVGRWWWLEVDGFQ